MLLAFDVGNSTTKIGLFDNKTLIGFYQISTLWERMPDEYRILLNSFLDMKGISINKITKIAYSSVVPPVSVNLKKYFEKTNIPFIEVNASVKTGIQIDIPNPNEVGSDLICNAVATYSRYQNNCIAVAFGTAITFVAIDKNAKIAGVSIAPGLNTAMKSLIKGTALLHSIPMEKPKSVMGKNTIESLQSGCIIGFEGLIGNILREMRNELPRAEIIFTGYHAQFFPCDKWGEMDEELTLNGLRIISELN